jgi:putative tricarboxylic transport membrane protein
MSQQGHAGKALAIAAGASFCGGIIGAVLLMLGAPVLAKASLLFQSSDYFALMVLGLVSVAAFAGNGGLIKALLMTTVGLMLSTVGTSQAQGIERFTLGSIDLIDGISFLLLVMATFALAEALLAVLRTPATQLQVVEKSKRKTLGSMRVSADEIRDISPTVARSSVLGFIIGLLPGAGATVASFLAYASEQRIAPANQSPAFGAGAPRGLAAPEAANNAAATGSFVPLLTLGIPGSGTTAILLGALIAYGIQPGPMLFINEPAVFWAVIVSMWLGNVVLLVLNLPLIPYIARILMVPGRLLLPLIMFFSIIGVYLVSFNTFDIQLMVLFAAAAVGLRLLNFPMAPMILGFILGGLMEENLGRALLIYDNNWSFLWTRPLTFGILLLAAVALSVPLLRTFLNRKEGHEN